MPHYRMILKMEGKNVQEFIIEDSRTQIDFVYLDYRKRVYQKNGAGRVVYFDMVMLADESLKHLEDREEVMNEKNSFGFTQIAIPKKKLPGRSDHSLKMTLGERTKSNR